MRLLSLLLLTFAALLGIGFALLNSESVLLNYFIGKKSLPLSVLILIVLLIGVAIGWLIALPSLLKLKWELRKKPQVTYPQIE